MQTQNLTTIKQHFPQLPAFLNPQSYAISQNDAPYFILYGKVLSLALLQQFQAKTQSELQLVEVWQEEEQLVALLQGNAQQHWQNEANQLQLDFALLDFAPQLDRPGLLVMDMDSTAIEMECIDEIAKLAGTGELVAEITERAMQGELDFEQSLRQRVATLKDAPESILQQVREKLPLMPGLQKTIKKLQQYGWKTAIASGGFTYFADHLKELLALDYAVSNQFEIQQGHLTGGLIGDIVHAQYKADTLQKLAKQYGIDLADSIAIGDGANDLPMMKVAGLGVAFHAKPKVQQQAQVVVNFADLTALLCLLSAKQKLHQLTQ